VTFQYIALGITELFTPTQFWTLFSVSVSFSSANKVDVDMTDEPDDDLRDNLSASSEIVGSDGNNGRISRSGAKSTKRSDPEALVERDGRALICVKILFLLVLLAAAGVAAAFIYAYTRNSQKRSFQYFSLISRSLADSLLDDTAFFFRAGQTISPALTVLMQAYNASHTTFNMPMSLYRPMVFGIAKNTGFLTWSPLLRNDDERLEFESMVAEKESEGFFTEGAITPCAVCDDESMRPSRPATQIQLPGVGEYTCDALYRAGVQGQIPAEACPYVVQAVLDGCSCKQSAAVLNATKRDRDPSKGLFRVAANRTVMDEPLNGGPYLPMWLDFTLITGNYPVLFNHLSHPKSARAVAGMLATGFPQLTDMYETDEVTFSTTFSRESADEANGPSSNIFYPVRTMQGDDIVGTVSLVITWSKLLQESVPRNGIYVNIVIESSCGDLPHTYRVKDEGGNMIWLGSGDLHDPKYDHMVYRTSYKNFDSIRLSSVDTTEQAENKTRAEVCDYKFSVYPTADLEDQYLTDEPWIFCVSVIAIFAFTLGLFILYDYFVRRWQAKIMKSAKQTNDIVSSLFPDAFRDRLYNQINAGKPGECGESSLSASNSKTAMTTFLTGSNQGSVFGSEPIADFFPSCTVLFIDIVSFTAWCSERELSQVFVLLENIYHAFDKVAEQLGIFKVETIGDSYVAVCGLPVPRADHAVIMTRFAFLCLKKMQSLVKSLEVTLGPSTGDLQARVGIHSGPVTAGVLRGTKARFQLFGDTINTASHMESSGIPNHIHASEQTAALLKLSNKSTWVVPREEQVNIKGKGFLQTYWLNPRRQCEQSVSSAGSVDTTERNTGSCPNRDENLMTNAPQQRQSRLVEWNVEVLLDLLTRVVARRESLQAPTWSPRTNEKNLSLDELGPASGDQCQIIDEMTQVISLPKFDPSVYRAPKQAELPEIVHYRSFIS
jgi:class 3 adenylate cyclase